MGENTYLYSSIADALSSPSSFLCPPLPPSSPAPSPHRRGGKYNHCRIHTKSEGGKTKFYLIDQMCFDSIYDLIVYYKVREVEEEGGGKRVVEEEGGEERWRRREGRRGGGGGQQRIV